MVYFGKKLMLLINCFIIQLFSYVFIFVSHVCKHFEDSVSDSKCCVTSSVFIENRSNFQKNGEWGIRN